MRTRPVIVGAALAGLVGISAAADLGSARGDPCAPSFELGELRARALDHAGLSASPNLRRRARLAGLVPDVAVRTSRTWAWDDPWTGARPADDEIARRDAFDVRLVWRLDRLVFDRAELSLVASERAAARARLDVEDQVTARYFRWRRAALDAEDTGGAREQLAAEEAFASLDALTGGWLATRARCRR